MHPLLPIAAWLAPAFLGGPPSQAQAPVQGAAPQVVDYTFQEAPLDARGVRGLADLRGKPVLIGFWGMGESECVEQAVPAWLELQEKRGEDLQVVLVESQGAEPKTAEAFAWRRRWMGKGVMWTREAPLQVEGDALPRFALLGCQGELLLSGDALVHAKAIEQAVAEQIKHSKAPPPGTSKALTKVWKSFHKGEVGAAIAECDALAAQEPEAPALRAELVARTQPRIARCQWLMDNGHVEEAYDRLLEIGRQVAGCTDFGEPIVDMLTRIAMGDDSLAAEIAAATALAAVESKMNKGDPFKRAHLEELGRIRGQYPSTRSAGRAEHLLELARIEF